MCASSPSFQEWEGSTSRPKPSDIDASDRLSGTDTAPPSSNDTGLTSRDGETLLPTPTQRDWKGRNQRDDASCLPGALTSSLAGSPASPSPPPAAARGSQTHAGYGLSLPVSLASWDPDTSSWRTSQVSLLSTEDERFPRSWETWPRSGMTRRGQAFALPRSERPTVESGSSSLPTPTAGDGKNARNRTSSRQPGSKHHDGVTLSDLFHTPTTGDTQPNYDHRASPGYTRAIPVPNLAAQVEELLPTPRTTDANGKGKHGDGGMDLRTSLGDLTNQPSEDGSE